MIATSLHVERLVLFQATLTCSWVFSQGLMKSMRKGHTDVSCYFRGRGWEPVGVVQSFCLLGGDPGAGYTHRVYVGLPAMFVGWRVGVSYAYGSKVYAWYLYNYNEPVNRSTPLELAT